MTPVPEIIFSGFVSKAVNNCVDVSWIKIKEAVKNGKTKHQTLESQVYNITVDVLNIITNNQYANNQDRIYDAAELLLKSFKENERNELGNIKSCLQVFQVNVNENECMKFRLLLYEEISKNKYIELYHAILLLLLEQKNQYDYVIYDQLNQKLDKVILILNQKKDDDIGNNVNQKIKSRTQEYADKWNANMFLNDFDKRDENAGVNVKLSEVYLEEHLPHYIWGDNKKISYDLKGLLAEYIEESKGNKIRTLLILGHPGIGKSTLITWIIANFYNRKSDILVYQFASDLKNIDWNCTTKNYMYWDEILKVLGFTYASLYGKILIFDGFDEINVRANRIDILNKLLSKEIRDLSVGFSLIITCRENYIYGINKIKYKYITLQAWDARQVKNFCNVYSEKSESVVSKQAIVNIINNIEILGIPLILYMVLALGISVEKETSIVDIYDKIFSLEGGIYDRCIDNKSFADPHWIGELKQQIHQISRKIAIWIFENNQAEAYIPKSEYQKICNSIIQEDNQEKEDFQKDFMIGNYFRLVKHCEGLESEKLYFVHRSIYEYFVAETIYSSIEKAMIKLTEESEKEFSGNISFYLKQGLITKNIGMYLQYKILKLFNSFDVDKKKCFYQWWEDAVQKMINNGMFFYTDEKIQKYKNIIDKEIQCFYNLVKILRILVNSTSTKKYILENVDKTRLEKYIRFRLTVCRMEERYGTEIFSLGNISLVGINLSGVDFTCANLDDANLCEAILVGANFEGMCMQRTNFRGADLSNANLKNVNLIGADLYEADLHGVNFAGSLFSESQIKYLKEKYNLQGALVQLVETSEDVDYVTYCNEYI